ncbi:MAG: VWA domain-containing protein [Chthoniobacter sp.]
MGALDHARGNTRLEEVKRSLRERIDGLLPDQQLCLIAFGKTARRLTPFTNDHRELREALDAVTVEDVPSDLEEALRLAQALGRTEPFDKVLLLSDGNLPTQANFELPFQIDFQKTAPGGSNFGIVAFSARRAPGGHWQGLRATRRLRECGIHDRHARTPAAGQSHRTRGTGAHPRQQSAPGLRSRGRSRCGARGAGCG